MYVKEEGWGMSESGGFQYVQGVGMSRDGVGMPRWGGRYVQGRVGISRDGYTMKPVGPGIPTNPPGTDT